jgi:acylphosphatase
MTPTPSDGSRVIRRRLLIAGVVQGVGYRLSLAERAGRAGLSGDVRNLDDGTVRATLQGPASMVADVEAWCRQGPPSARVQSVSGVDEPPVPGDGFAIL